MKRQKLHLFYSFAVIVAVLATSCSKKMSPLPNSLFTATPVPLELVGTQIPVTVNGRFPANWFDKNTTVTITPILKYQGGEALGSSQTYQGEKVAGNASTINQKTGGAITLRSSFSYVPAMKQSELYLRFSIVKNGKLQNGFPDIKIADGVNATASFANPYSVTPAIAPDAFQRIIKEAYDADIMFLLQQAELRSSELNSSNLAAWKALVKEADKNDRKNVDIEISAYASPDGGYSLNEKLAEKREKNTNEYLTKEFKKNDIDTEINAKYTAQDWEGFKKLVEASSLQDKDIVLRVLSMYTDPEMREKEIKNISAVYSDLTETILPQLRRSRLTANVEIIGKTDQELQSAANSSSISQLSIEELLYSATLNNVTKERIYTFATQKFPNDYRGWNNLGCYYFEQGDIAKANQMFTKATQLGSRTPEANMNLGLIAMGEGNLSKAEQLLGNAAGASTLGEAMGVLYMKKGDYIKAVRSFGNTQTNNSALAQILTKNYNQAQQTLNGISKKDATTYYLLAIIAARTNNLSGVAGNLKSAMDKGTHASDILSDTEFARYVTNPDLKNMLNR